MPYFLYQRHLHKGKSNELFMLLLLPILTFTFLKPILILCQGDLFLYGSETMICPIKRKGSWVGCLGWQRGRVRTFFLFNPFPLFQIKVEPLNSYFSIIQRKKGTFRNQWQSLYSSRPLSTGPLDSVQSTIERGTVDIDHLPCCQLFYNREMLNQST